MVTSREAEFSRPANSNFSMPEFAPTQQEKNRRLLEELRRKYAPQSFEPVTYGGTNNCINAALLDFRSGVEVAAEKGSRVVRLRLNWRREDLQALVADSDEGQEARDEACATITREYGILPDRVSFGTATRITHGAEPQRHLWMDIDFG